MANDFTPQISKLREILIRDSREAALKYRQYLMDDYKIGPNYPDAEPRLVEAMMPVAEKNSSGIVSVRKDAPEIIGKGKRQLVLGLDDEYVAKAANYFELDDFYGIKLSPNFVPRTADTIEFLNEKLGFDIQPMFSLGFEYDYKDISLRFDEGHYGTFMITTNLTEGRRYLVRDISKEDVKNGFADFSNGDYLKRYFELYINYLTSLFKKYSADDKSLDIKAEIEHHLREGLNTALRKMFFLKIDPTTNHAAIVIGDLDHVYFYKRRK